MSPPSTWTEQDIRLCADLWARGFSASAIGKQLGVSRGAVLGKLHRLGLMGAARGSQPKLKPPPVRAHAGSPAIKGPRRRRGPRILREVATGFEARPWISRAPGECAWPVAGEGEHILACCAPVGHDRTAWAYCPAHRGLMFRPAPVVDVEQLLRRTRLAAPDGASPTARATRSLRPTFLSLRRPPSGRPRATCGSNR